MRRFEVRGPRWQAPYGTDLETGASVFVPQVNSLHFLDVVALRTMVEVVQQWNDPRIAQAVSLDPLALAGPPQTPAEGSLEESVDAAVDLVDVMLRLNRSGICAVPMWAWAERREGKFGVVVPAPGMPPGLHTRSFPSQWMNGVKFWLKEQVDRRKGLGRVGPKPLRKALERSFEDHAAIVRDFVKSVAPHASRTGREKLVALERDAIESRERASAPLDFDRAIELGTARHAQMIAEGREKWDAAFVNWQLAAAHHHRACVRWNEGELELAIADADRAIELDPHTRYLTTRALFAENANDPRAGEFHDRAIQAFQKSAGYDDDSEETRNRDEARALRARGAFRTKHGDEKGAASDLEAARRRSA